MHQKNMDTPCSLSINALSNNINMAACHYACVDGCSNRLTVNGLLYITEIWQLCHRCVAIFSRGCWCGMIPCVQHSDTDMTHCIVTITHITDTWLPLPHYHTSNCHAQNDYSLDIYTPRCVGNDMSFDYSDHQMT